MIKNEKNDKKKKSTRKIFAPLEKMMKNDKKNEK